MMHQHQQSEGSRKKRAGDVQPMILLILVSLVACTVTFPAVDAARTWTTFVHNSKRGIHDSTKGGPAANEANPFLTFVDATDEPTVAPTTSKPTTFKPSFRPTNKPTSAAPTSNPTKFPTSQPISAPVTDEPSQNPTDKPTVDPTSRPTPEFWGVINTDPTCTSDSPCGPCEGRCEDDSECLDGLTCFERDNDDDLVPGCDGDPGNSRRSYCVVPEGAYASGWRAPTQNPTQPPTFEPTLPPTPQPTVRPTPAPTDEPTRAPVTDTPTYSPLAAAPFMHDQDCDREPGKQCDRCMGPCNRDRDCHPGLKCMDRSNRKDRDVPGCVGEAERGKNYCYLDEEDAADAGGWAAPTPTSTPTATPTSSPSISHQPTISTPPSYEPTSTPTRQPAKFTDSFQLELWWEKGYVWQGSSKPADWCMQKKGNIIEIEDCRSSKGEQKFVEYAGTIRPRGSLDKCFTKDGNDVVLDECDGDMGGNNQQWVLDIGKPRNYGPVDPPEWRRPYDVLREEEKFEIHPKNDLSKCVTNHHEPRSGEDLMIQDCINPRRSDTNYWKLG